MAVRLDAPTGTWQKQSVPSGVFQIIWKDTNAIIFKDTLAVIWVDREVELLEKVIGIEGIWERLELSITLFCGEETICCGNENYACDGGYVLPKASKPTGVWIKQDAPA